MKIAHISDTHLGYSQYNLIERKLDFIKAFRKAVDKIIELETKLVIHTGDMFESYQPDMFTLSKTIEQLQKLKDKNIKVITITGNHDRVLRRGKIPPQKILNDLGLVELIEPYGTIYINDICICGFQFMPKAILNVFLKEKKEEFGKLATKSDFSILMFHQGISNYLPFADSFELFMNDLPEEFNYYAGGHIHKFIQEEFGKGVLSYAGATEFRSTREATPENSRGFNIIDTQTLKLERVSIENLRNFLVYNTDEENIDEILTSIEKTVNDTNKPVVIINYTFENKPIDTFRETINSIKKRCLLLKIFPLKKSETEKTPSLDKAKTYHELVEHYFKEMPSHVKTLAVEVAKARSEHVKDILINFAEEMTGINWKT